MKIIHTADWHLGKVVNEYSMLEDQAYYFDQLIDQLKEVDADVLIMAGDLYDRAMPPREAIDLANRIFTRIIHELNLPIVAIAGNHDGVERVEYGSQLLAKSQLYIEGTLKEETRHIKIKDVNFWLMPFADHIHIRNVLGEEKTIRNLHDATEVQVTRIRERMDTSQKNVLLFHGYVINGTPESVESSESERPLSIGTAEYVGVDLFEDFDYVALGHLHKPQKVKNERVRYAGSPLKYSQSEVAHKKSVSIVTLEDEVTVEPLVINPLRDMITIKGQFLELMTETSDDYVFIELTDADYQMDAVNRLRLNYPNIMGLEYVERKRANTATPQADREKVQSRNMTDLFADFYEKYSEKTLDKPRREALNKIMDELEKGERQ